MNPYTQPKTLRPIIESVGSFFVMPFVILLLAFVFALTLLILLVLWPLSPFLVYVERKKEINENITDD